MPARAPAEVVMTNVAQEPQCRALVDKAVQRFGRIDALINNAGMSAQALFADVNAQDLHWYENLMKVNLWGSVWCTHAALPHLKASKGRSWRFLRWPGSWACPAARPTAPPSSP